MRSAHAVVVLLLAFIAALAAAGVADDAARGYAAIRPALVKVWAFDASGKPVESGSGIVIVSNASRSLVLTAAHVIAGAASIKVDIDRDRHDLVARVQQRGPRDLAVLELDQGHLVPATFASRTHAVVEGNVIAVAGYVKHDELIGVVGQEPRLLYPGTISSRPDGGA
jgi:S1-C subfamily serine protease